LIVDLHIKTLQPEGHFYERASCLAKYITEKTGTKPSLCCSLECEENDQETFEKIISTPGFNSFSFPSRAQSAKRILSDEPWLTLTKEYLDQSGLSTDTRFNGAKYAAYYAAHQVSHRISKVQDNGFLRYFSNNITRLYCANPESTVVTCKTIASMYTPLGAHALDALSPELISSSIGSIQALRFRDERENQALHRAASERITQYAISEGFSKIIFNTASPEDAIGSVTSSTENEALKNLDENLCLYFLFHQPSIFADTNLCYNLHRLQESTSISFPHLDVALYASCYEFKAHLEREEFSGIGRRFGIICGPFVKKSPEGQEAVATISTSARRSATGHLAARKALSRDRSWKSHDFFSLKKDYQDRFSEGYLTPPNRQSNFTSAIRSELRLKLENRNDQAFLTFLGDIRDEKRFSDFLRVSKEASKARNMRISIVRPDFFSNGAISDSKMALDKHLSDGQSLHEVTYGRLDDSDYFWLLHQSNCIYAAYDRGEYSCKQSGIFYEALLHAIPTIINIGTASSHALGRLCHETLILTDFPDKQRIFSASAKGPRTMQCKIPETNNEINFDIILSIERNCNNPLSRSTPIHCFFEASLVWETAINADHRCALTKKIEYRGVANVACIFSRTEIRSIAQHQSKDINLILELTPTLGLEDRSEYTASVDIIRCGDDKSEAGFFARHVIIDLDEDHARQSLMIEANRDCWWRSNELHDRYTEIAERIIGILEREMKSVAES